MIVTPFAEHSALIYYTDQREAADAVNWDAISAISGMLAAIGVVLTVFFGSSDTKEHASNPFSNTPLDDGCACRNGGDHRVQS